MLQKKTCKKIAYIKEKIDKNIASKKEIHEYNQLLNNNNVTNKQIDKCLKNKKYHHLYIQNCIIINNQKQSPLKLIKILYIITILFFTKK